MTIDPFKLYFKSLVEPPICSFEKTDDADKHHGKTPTSLNISEIWDLNSKWNDISRSQCLMSDEARYPWPNSLHVTANRLPRPVYLINPYKFAKYRMSGEEYVNSDNYAFVMDYNTLMAAKTNMPKLIDLNYYYTSSNVAIENAIGSGNEELTRIGMYKLYIHGLVQNGRVRIGWVNKCKANSYSGFDNNWVGSYSSTDINWKSEYIDVLISNGRNQTIEFPEFEIDPIYQPNGYLCVHFDFASIRWCHNATMINAWDIYRFLPIVPLNYAPAESDLINADQIVDAPHWQQWQYCSPTLPNSCRYGQDDMMHYRKMGGGTCYHDGIDGLMTKNDTDFKNKYMPLTAPRMSNHWLYSQAGNSSIYDIHQLWSLSTARFAPYGYQDKLYTCIISGNEFYYSDKFLQPSNDICMSKSYVEVNTTGGYNAGNSVSVIQGGLFSKMVTYSSRQNEYNSFDLVIGHYPDYKAKIKDLYKHPMAQSDFIIDRTITLNTNSCWGTTSDGTREVHDLSGLMDVDPYRIYYIICRHYGDAGYSTNHCHVSLIPKHEIPYPLPVYDCFKVTDGELEYDGNTLYPGYLTSFTQSLTSAYNNAVTDIWDPGQMEKTYTALTTADPNFYRHIIAQPNTSTSTKCYNVSASHYYTTYGNNGFCGYGAHVTCQDSALSMTDYNGSPYGNCTVLLKPNEKLYLMDTQQNSAVGDHTVTIMEKSLNIKSFVADTSANILCADTLANHASAQQNKTVLLNVNNLSAGSQYDMIFRDNVGFGQCNPFDIWIAPITSADIPWDAIDCITDFSNRGLSAPRIGMSSLIGTDITASYSMDSYKILYALSGTNTYDADTFYFNRIIETDPGPVYLYPNYPNYELMEIPKNHISDNFILSALNKDVNTYQKSWRIKSGKLMYPPDGGQHIVQKFTFTAPYETCRILIREFDMHRKRGLSSYDQSFWNSTAFNLTIKKI